MEFIKERAHIVTGHTYKISLKCIYGQHLDLSIQRQTGTTFISVLSDVVIFIKDNIRLCIISRVFSQCGRKVYALSDS